MPCIWVSISPTTLIHTVDRKELRDKRNSEARAAEQLQVEEEKGRRKHSCSQHIACRAGLPRPGSQGNGLLVILLRWNLVYRARQHPVLRIYIHNQN